MKKTFFMMSLLGAFAAFHATEAVADSRIFEKSVPELQKQLQSGKLTSKEMVNYYLTRIKVYDGAINSMITVNPNALAEAEKLDKMRASGQILGPLHGIPIILKDNYDTKDMVTTSGSKSLAKLLPPKDAFTVDKMRKAGAIFIGKSNLTEFARHGMTVSSQGGQTLNPYDLTRTPGGSSGGTGASIASNFAVMGTGSDTVNSIRSPSSANSLVGIRPTKGLVSRTGISPCSGFQDQGGPIAKTVTDAAIMLGVMAGYDPADATTEAVKDKAIPDYTKALNKSALKGKKIGLLTTNLGDDPEVLKIVDQSVVDVAKQGATVVKIDIPELRMSTLSKEHDVQKWEQAPHLDAYLKSEGSSSPVKSYAQLVKENKFTKSIVKEMAMFGEEKDPLNNPEYLARLKKNADLTKLVVKTMDENGIDAFLYPLQSVLVVETNDPRGQTKRNGLMASVTGLPAIDLPGGFSTPTDTAPIGVPVGMELMGRPFSEETLIGMGYAYEQATKHRKPPKSTPDLDFSSVK